MAYIDIDVDDYLGEASESCLRREVNHRIENGSWRGPVPGRTDSDGEPWTRRGLADDIRTAFYARNASRLEELLSVLEQREAA